MEEMMVQTANVIPIHSSDIFTTRPKLYSNRSINGLEYARLVAKGRFRPPFPDEELDSETLRLNLDHLADPVPASAYFDARYQDCLGDQKHCGTITDDSFRLRLSLGESFWRSSKWTTGRDCLSLQETDRFVSI
jgi:hypothetical protein